jgi:hypothetical protein
MAGYLGTTPVPHATQHRQQFTATSLQTSFATAGYTPQFIDVYLNGVKLTAADYTATNGSDVVLTVGAAVNDILEYVAYTPFEVADQTFTGATIVDDLNVGGAFTSLGIDDNATSTAITIDSSENVGIGNLSPATALDVTGTITSDGLAVDGGASGSNTYLRFTEAYSLVQNAGFYIHLDGTDDDLYIGRHDAGGVDVADDKPVIGIDRGTGDVSFYEDTGTTPKFFWDASAESLGIGTSSPLAPLHVKTNDAVVIIEDANNGVGGTAYRPHQAFWANGDRVGAIGMSDSDNLELIADDFNSAAIKFETGGSEAMRIDSSGNVGIGTSSPDEVLEVNGDIKTSGSGFGIIQFGDTSDQTKIVGRDTSHATLPSTMEFYTNSNERLRIDSSGNVGLGTSSPSSRLHVEDTGDTTLTVKALSSGAGNDDDANLIIDASGGGEAKINFSLDGAEKASIEWFNGGPDLNIKTASGTNGNIDFQPNGTLAMRIDSSGHAIIPAGVTLGTAAGVYSAANTLDDYEEGTWGGSSVVIDTNFGVTSVVVNAATYTKVGNLVTVRGIVDLTGGAATSLGDYLEIDGLPFAAKLEGSSRSPYTGSMMVGSSPLDNRTGSGYSAVFENTDQVTLVLTNLPVGSATGTGSMNFTLSYII